MKFECVGAFRMRVVISAPRKSGASHLRCLLSMAYELKAPPLPAPKAGDPADVARWLTELPEGSVSTCDLSLSALEEPASDAHVQVIGIIRHPFDLFVSNYDVAQQRAARGREDDDGNRSWDTLSGEELDGDVTRQYASGAFAAEIQALRDWASHGMVRYEELITEPAAVLRSLSSALGPLSDDQIRHAMGLCPVENAVASRPGRGRRMPSLLPGTWRERLPDSLLATLRANYSLDVTALGYDAF